MKNRNLLISVFTVVAIATSACSKDKPKTSPLKGDNEVLATVNDQKITQYDLENTIYTSFGKTAVSEFDDQARRSVLESLVSSRAIARKRETELGELEKAALEKRIQAYREKLLVKQYLAKHAPPKPVTKKAIEEYYRDNQERFGGKKVKIYEMLFTVGSVAAGERKTLMEKLAEPGKREDWKSWSKQLVKKGLAVQYRTGPVKEKLLNPKLAQVMQTLKPGQASKISFIEGKAYVVRITEELGQPARPLGEVKDEIQQLLRRQEMKKSVQKVSEEILREAKVEYR